MRRWMITHEFLSALKDHFILKDKCHDRDGICNFKNQVNYIFFLKWKEDTHFSPPLIEGKKVKVDFEEFLQSKNTYFKMDTIFCYYNTHSFIWDTL